VQEETETVSGYPVSNTGYQNYKTVSAKETASVSRGDGELLSIMPRSETEQTTSAYVVASRPDWLTVSIPDPAQMLLPDLMAQLSGVLGSESSVETAWDFLGETLHLQRDGKGLPRLVAKDYCEFRFFTTGGRVSCQFSVFSFPFWLEDATTVFQYASGLISQVCGRAVSAVPVRLDLARDVVGFALDDLGSLDSIYAHVVTRSRKKRPNGSTPSDDMVIDGGRHVESVYLGGPKSPVRWAIYDKTLETRRRGKTYYQAVWSEAGYDGSAQVVRFEARLRGRVWQELARYGVQHGLPALTLDNLHEWLAPLWSWLTHSHTRMVVPDDTQTNRSRLVTSSFWSMMQAPFDDGGVVVALQRERLRAPSRDALGAQSEGCLLSMAALTPGSEHWSQREIAAVVIDLVGWRCGTKGVPWASRVLERRSMLAVS